MFRYRGATAVAFVAAVLASSSSSNVLARAQDEAQASSQEVPEGYTAGEPVTLGQGITVTVQELMDREASRPHGAVAPRRHKPERLRPMPRPRPEAPEVSRWPVAASDEQEVPLHLRPHEPKLPQTVGTDFLGILGGDLSTPPDTIGDVGPTQILVATNQRIKVFDKTGTPGALDMVTDAFWSSVATNTTDPHVRYDRLSGRWFVVAIDVDDCPNKILIAVSSSSTITNSSSFTFFSFVAQSDAFTDYPTLGVDKFALYIGGNQFPDSDPDCDLSVPPGNAQNSVWVVRKSDLLNDTLTVTPFLNLVDFNNDIGSWTLQGVHNDDPDATEGYFIGTDYFFFSSLPMRRIADPGGTPSISAQINISVPSTTLAPDQPQPGGSPDLDGLDDRPFAASVHKNKITGTKTLWTAHNFEVNSSGVAANNGKRLGSRWYEIQNLTTTPELRQSGTLFDSSNMNTFGFWIPSVAMSGQGHMALGASRASTSASGGHASTVASGRLRTDTLGTQQAATLTEGSTFHYNIPWCCTTVERWGDYSQTVVDPNDDQTLWTFQEYAGAADRWAVRVTQLKAPLPALPTTADPPTVEAGLSSVTVVITGTSTNGTEFFDPGSDPNGPGFANHIDALVSGGITVNSVTFDSTTQATLDISTVGAVAGAQDVTIINPDGQSATGVGILTVAAACPAIDVLPDTIPSATVGTPYSQTFSQTGIPSPPVTWSLTGSLPSGLSFNAASATLSGTPTQAGSFNFRVTATAPNQCSGFQDYTLTVCATITVNPATIPDPFQGVPYSQQFTQTGGVGAITWSSSGTLPDGLTLNASTGVLSGTPTQTGPFTFTIIATDENDCTGSRQYTVTVQTCPTITVNPPTAADGFVGVVYSQQFTQTDGVGTITWSSTGTLPGGLTLNASTGVLSGTPTQAGQFTFTIVAADANGCMGSREYTVTIGTCPSITISPSTAPNGFVGVAYSQDFDNSGGVGTITWSFTGTLPDGLSLNTSTGVLSGTPSQAGQFTFTIVATDAGGCAGSRQYTVTIGTCPSITISPATAPNGFVGVAYSQDFDNSGGVGTITWSFTGTLPDGLSLNSSTGVLSGTPTQAGQFTFTIVATDAGGCAGSRQYTVTITLCPKITISPATAPDGFVGVAYSQDFDNSAGVGTITWGFTGTLPNGLSLNTSTGVLSGTPSQAGQFTFTIVATDAGGCTGTQPYTVNVGTCPSIAVDPATAAHGFLGVAYSQQFTQTGGAGITWAFTGTLPSGVTLDSSTGLLSGTPTATGTFTFTIFATDAGGCTGSRGYSVTIGVPVPAALDVDTAGNSVFEPNETVIVAPTWSNPVAGVSVDLTGSASGFSGPGGPPNQTYTTVDAAADYGTIAALSSSSCTSTGNCYSFGVTSTARPAFHWDTTFVEDPSVGSNKTWTLHIGDSFADVSLSNGFYRNIEIMLHRGVTNGCGITGDRLRYCPADSTTREQMAKFVLISKEGPGYVPPACNPADPRIFADVTATNGFCGFVEELSRRGVVNGCGVNPPLYCPKGTVTREQMSKFVLRTLDPSINPPACVAGQETFADVPASNGFCPFIQELFTRGIVNGCGINPLRYCPADNVTREQMSKFLGLTFGLTLYGP